jgi:hypothetical protein
MAEAKLEVAETGVVLVGGSIVVPLRCRLEAERLSPLVLLWLRLIAAGGREGDCFEPSSFLITADVDGVGEATEPEKLRARSSWSRLGTAFDDFCELPKGFRRRPFWGELALPFRAGAGESAGLGLPPMRKVILGVGSAILDIFNFSFG